MVKVTFQDTDWFSPAEVQRWCLDRKLKHYQQEKGVIVIEGMTIWYYLMLRWCNDRIRIKIIPLPFTVETEETKMGLKHDTLLKLE